MTTLDLVLSEGVAHGMRGIQAGSRSSPCPRRGQEDGRDAVIDGVIADYGELLGSGAARTASSWTGWSSTTARGSEAVRFCGREWAEDTERIDCVNEEIDDLEPLRAFPRLRELSLAMTNPHGTSSTTSRGSGRCAS